MVPYSKTPPLTAALILHNEGDKLERKAYIEDFKKTENIDVLIVNQMLLTGFDAPRLKKLYLGRVLDGHDLLQALTRVNRPYKDFKYGYVVDFVDIKENFDSTNDRYLREAFLKLKFKSVKCNINDAGHICRMVSVIQEIDSINPMRHLGHKRWN